MVFVSSRLLIFLSGIRESDSCLLLGKQPYYHCTNPANTHLEPPPRVELGTFTWSLSRRWRERCCPDWLKTKSHLPDLHWGPSLYESAALLTELRWLLIFKTHRDCDWQPRYHGGQSVTHQLSYPGIYLYLILSNLSNFSTKKTCLCRS